MTRADAVRPVRRVVSSSRGELVVEVRSTTLVVRLKRHRRVVSMSWAQVLEHGLWLATPRAPRGRRSARLGGGLR